MRLIICTDAQNGITFNQRRVSKDAVVTMDILKSIGYKKLYIDRASLKLFQDFVVPKEKYGLLSRPKIVVVDNLPQFLASHQIGSAYAFFETAHIQDFIDKAGRLIWYNWNREYPHDTLLSIPNSFHIRHTTEFAGKSHEKITKSIFQNI